MLSVQNLVKMFSENRAGRRSSVVAVDGVSLDVEEGKLYTLLGPSGCGKTTTLRMVAGLELPDAGAIEVAGRQLFSSEARVNVATHRRGLGMVFQSYAIWPNMTVRQNVAFALKGRGVRGRKRFKRAQIPERVEEVLDLVGLTELKDRRATRLSGGQQQRLALARALAPEPPVLLLDEPLSNLDQKLRERMRLSLKRMQRDLGVTTLYVTHDQLEAMALSNVVAVMNAGRIEQQGHPREVYNSPATSFVADFVGRMNFIHGNVEARHDGDQYVVATARGKVFVTNPTGLEPGAAATVMIRPENVQVAAASTTAAVEPGVWSGEVERREFLGEAVHLDVRVQDGGIVHVRATPRLPVAPGDRVHLNLPAQDCTAVPA